MIQRKNIKFFPVTVELEPRDDIEGGLLGSMLRKGITEPLDPSITGLSRGEYDAPNSKMEDMDIVMSKAYQDKFAVAKAVHQQDKAVANSLANKDVADTKTEPQPE